MATAGVIIASTAPEVDVTSLVIATAAFTLRIVDVADPSAQATLARPTLDPPQLTLMRQRRIKAHLMVPLTPQRRMVEHLMVPLMPRQGMVAPLMVVATITRTVAAEPDHL
jgi:hypothetical protein